MLKFFSLTAVAALAAMAIVGCSSEATLNGVELSSSIAPGDDFYEYVNSNWRQANPLTGEHASYGKFDILNDSSEARVKNIVTGLAATNPEPGSVAFKVSTIYNQAMDSTRRNAEGAEPIRAHLRKIESTPADSMTDLFIWMQAGYGSPLMGVGIQENLVNSNEYAMYVGGGSMGLGDRDYYLENDERNTAVRQAYKRLIVDQLVNAGYDSVTARRIMATVMKIETEQAVDARTREESRNIEAMYNPMTFDQLKAAYPAFPWDRFFVETLGIESPTDVIVTDPKAMARANAQMASLTDQEKRDYYIWEYVSGAAPYLSDAFSDASFEFNKVYSGVEEQRPRWKRALSATEGTMGEAIGQLYVERYFPASSKEYMEELVENLRTALSQHIDSLTWMSDTTKARAQEKLRAFTVKIGYPDKWKDYTTMTIDPEKSYYENMHEAGMWHLRDMMSKWGKPVDRTEWGMTPQTVNAYYNPLANEIVFPAAILQAPFFDPNASDAENYGGIGVVIGHEMTHGFDDQGRQFDAQGNMTDWWTPADAEAFSALTQKLVEQFNEAEVIPGVKANGEYTLGENIADQGGLRIAMTAFLNAQKEKGVDVETLTIDGFPAMQAFYINYANLWGQNIRDEYALSLNQGDVHSIGKNRVNVSLRNIEPFFKAFGITEGQPMFRPEEERVIIW